MRFRTVLSLAGVGHNRSRSGSFATEMIIAAIITGITMAILVPGLAAVGKQRQLQKFEALARIELNNLEQANSRSAESAWTLSEWFVHRYPDAELSSKAVTMSESSATLPQGVRLAISRRNAVGQVEQSVSLVIWPEQSGDLP